MVNWYKRAADQTDFSFMEDESVKTESPRLYHSDKSEDTLQDLMDESTGFLAVESNLMRYGYDWKLVKFPSGDRVAVVTIGKEKFIVDDFMNPYARDAHEWLWRLDVMDMESYFPGRSFTEEFWGGYGNLYHGTNEENLKDILAHGLDPRDGSRGIENRDTGKAVFMSPDFETAASYYPVVLEIDTAMMARDGFQPEMEKEGPINRAELLEAVAHRLGIEDFVAEVEAGISSETVLCRQTIPVKYLRRVK